MKYRNQMVKYLVPAALLAPALSHAAVDYTALTAAVDFAGLGAAVSGVIIALIGVSLLIAGGMAMWSITKKGRSV